MTDPKIASRRLITIFSSIYVGSDWKSTHIKSRRADILFGKQKSNERPSLAIPIPEGTDPKIWERTRLPIRNKKKYTAEEIDADYIRYQKEMAYKSSKIAAYERNRAVNSGYTHFSWVTAGDANVCEECGKNSGKKFRFDKVSKIGFPGDHICPQGWCRCLAIPIIRT